MSRNRLFHSFQLNQVLAISVSIFLVACAPGPVGTQAPKAIVKAPTKTPSQTPGVNLPTKTLTPESKGNKATPPSPAKVQPKPEDKTPVPAGGKTKPEDKVAQPTLSDNQLTSESLKQEENELKALTIPAELSEDQTSTIELGEQPDAATKDSIQKDVTQKLKANTAQKVNVTGQLELPSTGFNTQQTSSSLANYIVQLYGPDGSLLAETTADSQGKYSFANIPSGIRAEIIAFPPFAHSNRMTAMVDIPPANTPNQSVSSNVSSRSTALMRVVRSAKRRGKSNIDRVSVKKLEERFKSDIDAVDEQMKLTLNQQVMEQLKNDPNNPTLLTTLSQGRSKQARAIRKAAQTFRKASFEDDALQSLDSNIITSPIVLRGSVTFDAVVVPAPTNLMVVRRSTSEIEIQWDFANAGNHTYKVYLDGQLKAQDYTRHIFSFKNLSAAQEYLIELQTITDSGESGKISLKTSTTAQGNTGTGNFGGGGDTGSDANPTTTTTTTKITTTTPVITSVAPTSGVIGTSVTIAGSNFDTTPGNNTVTFGTTPATVTTATSTSLTVTVPAGASIGANNITIAINGLTSNSNSNSFIVNSPLTLAGETRINTYTTSNQDQNFVATDTNGNFVVVWRSYGSNGTDTDGASVQAQRFNSAGVAQGSQFQVNNFTTGAQTAYDVAYDSNGNFIIAWTSFGSFGNDVDNSIQARRYNSVGVALDANEFQVNTYTTSNQNRAKIATDNNGNFVIAWQGYGVGTDNGGTQAINARRFNSTGTPIDANDFQVNTYTTGTQERPSLAMDNSGNFVITWSEKGGQDGNNSGVYAQRYSSNPTLTPVGTEFQVNTYTTSFQQDSSVAMDSVGNFVVSWRSNNQDGNSAGVFAQRYSSNPTLTPVGTEFQVNTYTTSFQNLPQVSMDAVGNFIVSWASGGNQDGDNEGVFAQRYSSNPTLTPVGVEFQVNTSTTVKQTSPAIALNDNGNYVIIWKDTSALDGDNSGIFGQRYNSDGTAQ